MVLADGVVAGAQVQRGCERDTRRGPIGKAQVGLEFAVGVYVRVQVDVRLVTRVWHVHRRVGLGDNRDVDAGTNGEPVVELTTQRKGKTGCGCSVAQLFKIELVREVLFPLIGKEPLFVEEAIDRQKTVEAEDQVFSCQRADQTHDRIEHMVVFVGVAARVGQVLGC